MSCIAASELAMRRISDFWVVKHIPRRLFFKLDGPLAVLWDLLLRLPNERDAAQDFMRTFGWNAQAVHDAPHLLTLLRTYGLLTGAPNGSGLTSDFSDGASAQHSDLIQDEMFRAAAALGHPLLAEYEMTYRCNLRCLYCYQPTYLKHQKKAELSESDLTLMLRDFAEAGVFFLIVTGGECTLCRNFAHVIRQARANFMDVTVLTNATAITPETADLLAEYRVSEVKVSIYGSTADEYKTFTGSAVAFHRVIDSIEHLSKAGIHVTAKVVVTKLQEGSFRKTMQLLQDLGVAIEVSCHVMPAIDGDLFPLKYRVSSQTLNDLYREQVLRPAGGRSCTAGMVKFRVNPEGFVTSCELERTPIGCVRSQSIRDILQTENTKKLVSIIHDSASIAARNSATSGLPCPALAKLEEGSWQSLSTEAIRWTKAANQAHETSCSV